MTDLLITDLGSASALDAANEIELQQTALVTVKTTLGAAGDFSLTRIDNASAGSNLVGSEKIAGFSSGVKTYTPAQIGDFALTRIDNATVGGTLVGSEKIAGFSSGVKTFTPDQISARTVANIIATSSGSTLTGSESVLDIQGGGLVKHTLNDVGDYSLTRIDNATAGSALTGTEKLAGFSTGAKSYTATQVQTLAHKFPVEATPSVPGSGLELFAQEQPGLVLNAITPNGIKRLGFDWAQGYLFMQGPSNTTSLTVFGSNANSFGTISNPTATTNTGRVAKGTSAATGNAVGGSSMNVAALVMGNATGPYGGWAFNWIGSLDDASYNNTGAGTGRRIFMGATSNTLDATVLSDNPAGHHAGFFRVHVNGGLTHTNWQFMTKDNSTINIVDTGLAFTATNVIEARIENHPGSNVVKWAIRDITANSGWIIGSTSTNVPLNTAILRTGWVAGAVDTTAASISMSIHIAMGMYRQS